MPFCPKCRDEYQEWVKTCPDCGVELVEQLESVPWRAEPELPSPAMDDDAEDDTYHGERCPECNSVNIHYETHSLRPLYFLMLILGMKFSFLTRQWKCNDCGYQWDSRN